MKTYKQFLYENFPRQLLEASLWDYMYKKNKAIFYRGQSSSGKGMGIGMLGLGIYLTWSESMAQSFAKKQSRGVVQTFKVKRGLKMADNTSNDFAKAMANLGRKPWEWSHSKEFSGFLTGELKQMGYDGAYSDNPAEGIVIFDKKNAKEIK
ncbi:uncharacterized protein METZ01_LOCUS173310 [marine metagenome]|uniref:Uncharacterized protein n=1 Tax=marine metagenome TaxID=408172 RepID=A0A382C313_9ZZZZ